MILHLPDNWPMADELESLHQIAMMAPHMRSAIEDCSETDALVQVRRAQYLAHVMKLRQALTDLMALQCRLYELATQERENPELTYTLDELNIKQH